MRVSACLERGTAFDRRRHARHSVQIGAGLDANVRPSSPIAVIDLSTGGCGIETDIQLEPQTRVWLKLPGLESWPCRVAWSDGTRAGLAFDRPLHEAVVNRFVRPA
ncbi:PilZ domain-containing protein [Allosphingosinicella sp.]|uniref:PilZ domain-containing protein n=1 Tax=Allosphingosinicella sp. TaxID=2823234 RepID=UPI002EF8EF64